MSFAFNMFRQGLRFLGAGALAVLFLNDPALAQAKSSEPAKPAATAPAQPVTPVPATAATPAPKVEEKVADVEGFRSAKFGATEAEVRAAIAKDFPGAVASIKESTNLAERTKILTIRSPDVLPDSGTAEIAYIFGYKTKALIQVSVVWSKDTDPALTGLSLTSNGQALRGYFLDQGFAPADVLTNVGTADGVILFRGTDKQGHQVLLILRGTMNGDLNAAHTFTPSATTLFYIAKTADPDIFKVPPGKF